MIITHMSFDPGMSTGVVTAGNVDLGPLPPLFDLGPCGIVSYDKRANLYNLLSKHAHSLQVIVIEDFALQASKAQAQINSRFETVKVIERLQVYSEQLGIANKIVMQMPAVRLSAKGMSEAHALTLANNRHLVAAYQHLRYNLFMTRKRRNRA